MEVLCELLSSPSGSSSPSSRVSSVPRNRCRSSISVSSVSWIHLEPSEPSVPGEPTATWNLWFCIVASQASFRHRKCRKYIGNAWTYLPKPDRKQARVPRYIIYIHKLSDRRSHLEPHPILWQTILLTEHRSWQTAQHQRSVTILEIKPLFGRVFETSLRAHEFL